MIRQREGRKLINREIKRKIKAGTMKILVIGCSGFIGSHLITAILQKFDWNIVGIDVSTAKIENINSDNFSFHQIDYSHHANDQIILTEIKRCDVVINLAAICNPSQYNKTPLKVIKSNFIDSYKLIDLCAQERKWLIHFSTSEVYGRTLSSYLDDNAYETTAHYELDENLTPLIMGPIHNQRWSYACAKQLLERYVMAHHVESDLEFTMIRPLNFFGPRMDFIPGVDGEGRASRAGLFYGSVAQGPLFEARRCAATQGGRSSPSRMPSRLFSPCLRIEKRRAARSLISEIVTTR